MGGEVSVFGGGVCVCGRGGEVEGDSLTRKNDENNKNVVSLFRGPTVIATSSSVGVQKGSESQRTVTIRWLLEQPKLTPSLPQPVKCSG